MINLRNVKWIWPTNTEMKVLLGIEHIHHHTTSGMAHGIDLCRLGCCTKFRVFLVLRALEDSGFVFSVKDSEVKGGLPIRLYHLTAQGWSAVKLYHDILDTYLSQRKMGE